MPRKAGAQNYKKEVLLEVMATFLPNQGSNSWEQVAAAYHKKSGEVKLRNEEDCMKKVATSLKNNWKSGAATKFILECQRVQLLIYKKNEASLLGGGSGSSSGSDEDEDHDSSWTEELH
jgi:hypothetical protein